MATQRRIVFQSSKDTFLDAYEVEENVCFINIGLSTIQHHIWHDVVPDCLSMIFVTSLYFILLFLLHAGKGRKPSKQWRTCQSKSLRPEQKWYKGTDVLASTITE
jgi:hypothetical protein